MKENVFLHFNGLQTRCKFIIPGKMQTNWYPVHYRTMAANVMVGFVVAQNRSTKKKETIVVNIVANEQLLAELASLN